MTGLVCQDLLLSLSVVVTVHAVGKWVRISLRPSAVDRAPRETDAVNVDSPTTVVGTVDATGIGLRRTCCDSDDSTASGLFCSIGADTADS